MGGILHRPVTNFMADFAPRITCVWGMLSEAAGSSSAGLGLHHQFIIYQTARDSVEEKHGGGRRRDPKFFTAIPSFVVQD